jgi:hypothetical protein
MSPPSRQKRRGYIPTKNGCVPTSILGRPARKAGKSAMLMHRRYAKRGRGPVTPCGSLTLHAGYSPLDARARHLATHPAPQHVRACRACPAPSGRGLSRRARARRTTINPTQAERTPSKIRSRVSPRQRCTAPRRNTMALVRGTRSDPPFAHRRAKRAKRAKRAIAGGVPAQARRTPRRCHGGGEACGGLPPGSVNADAELELPHI